MCSVKSFTIYVTELCVTTSLFRGLPAIRFIVSATEWDLADQAAAPGDDGVA